MPSPHAPLTPAARSVVDGLSAGGNIRVATVVLRDGEQYKTLEEVNKVRARSAGFVALRVHSLPWPGAPLHTHPPRCLMRRWAPGWTGARRWLPWAGEW